MAIERVAFAILSATLCYSRHYVKTKEEKLYKMNENR